MDKARLLQSVRDNPAWIDTLKEAIQIEEQGEEKQGDRYLGWEWFEAHTQPATLKQMVSCRILNITMSSRSSTYYKLADREQIKEILETIETGEYEQEERHETPADLFQIIVGHEEIKHLFNKSLGSKKPVHILLYGPPATAKTLFLGELSRLPDCKYVLGSSVSKAGITDYLLEYMPTYLIIDELEKCDSHDFSALLSLMETGIVTRLKKNMRESKLLKTWVFAGANSIKKLPHELKSRFLRYEVLEYGNDELTAIAKHILTDEGYSEDMIEYGVQIATQYSRDVRDVLRIIRLSEDKSEVNYLVNTLQKRSR